MADLPPQTPLIYRRNWRRKMGRLPGTLARAGEEVEVAWERAKA